MKCEVSAKNKNLTWRDVSFPWPGIYSGIGSSYMGEIVLFTNKTGGGVVIVGADSEHCNRDAVGKISTFEMAVFTPMNPGTSLTLIF